MAVVGQGTGEHVAGAGGAARLRAGIERHGPGPAGGPSWATTDPGRFHLSDRYEAEEALRASEARFRTVISGSYDTTAVIDADGIVRWVTPNCRRLLGCPPEDIIGRNCLDWIHPDNLATMAEALCTFVAGDGVSNPAPIRMRHADGDWRDVEVVAADFLDHPDIAGIAVNLRDIGERVAVERERERLTQIFAMTSDLVSTYDLRGGLVYVNEAARRFMGAAPDVPAEAIDVHTHLTPSARTKLTDEIMLAITAGDSWTGELDFYDGTGRVVPMQAQLLGHRDARGELHHISAVLRDISERKSFERRLRHEATHDALTALPNRTLMLDRLGTAMDRCRRHGGGIALLFCDLDHFKVVNDSLGHSRGDLVLAEVARRLQHQLRPGDTVARFGGDEFVILGEGCATIEDAVSIASRVHHAMDEAFVLDGVDVHVGVSIGISLAAPVAGSMPDPEMLLRDADAAMYRAKERGRGRYQVFEDDCREPTVDRIALQDALRQAVARSELGLLYQPVVALGGHPGEDRLVGAEALLRWDHPHRGRLLPAEFLPVAEETGLVGELGAWVITGACRQLARWQDAAASRSLAVAVNVAGGQLAHPGLIDVVGDALRSAGVAADRLELEVTEPVLSTGDDGSRATLAALRRLGVKIVLDDFGAGASSLGQLRGAPLDRLKVDPALVAGLGLDPGDTAMVRALVELAHGLGISTVAEGVETPEQARLLRSVGCHRAQGFHFGGPMAEDEVGEWLAAD
jgi:diguanylate cyclase (GGDEF)-like protein/PAS domain S-box-containing protein